MTDYKKLAKLFMVTYVKLYEIHATYNRASDP